MEDSTISKKPIEDEIQPVDDNNEGSIAEDDDEQYQLLLNISLDKIENINEDETESFSSNASSLQLSTMEKFNYIATRILYSKSFQFYYFFIIILSGLSIVLSYLLECTNGYHLALEALIIAALIIEVTIRLLAQRKYFFYSFWNILDIIIIVVCVWLFYITKQKCPVNDRIIDNSILVIRYVIQFIRLGILLKKNKSSSANDKRKSVNFNQFRDKPNYESINPSSSSSHPRRKRKNILRDSKVVDEEGENDSNDNYQNIGNIINSNIYNPYGVRYSSNDDSHVENIYENIPNESFTNPINNSYFSQSLAAYIQETAGSIDFNINSNANLAKMFFGDESSTGELDSSSRKRLSSSVHSANNDIYQKLIHSNIENNNRNSYSVLPNAAGVPVGGGYRIPTSSTQPERGPSNDSLSTNPIETPSSSIISPSSGSFLKIPFIQAHFIQKSQGQLQSQQQQQQSQPQLQPQKSISSSIQTDSSMTSSLPPKIGKKTNYIFPTNHSSTFSEIPSRVNLLTPILYGSPVIEKKEKEEKRIT